MEGHDPQRSGRSATVGVSEPRLSWSPAIDQPSFGQPVFGIDGSVYLGTEGGKLLSFTPAGQLAWSFSATGPVPSPAIGPDGTAYLRGGDGTLYALGPDGRRRWTTDIGAQPPMLGPAPLVGPDSYTYLASYHSSLMYLVQPGGFFQWAYNARARTPGSPAVAADGLIYFGAADGKVRALDSEQNEQWTFDAGGPVISSPAIGPDGTIYFLTGGGQSGLIALDRAGRRLWSAAPCWEAGAPVLWPAVASDGQIQVANCAIAKDGKVRWKAPLAGPWATPAALDADGNAYYGSGRVLSSVAPDGTPRWSYSAEGEVGPPSLGAYGTVALSSKSVDRLYLLGR
jgi:outer membrane protein assembly factor BamB